MYSETDEGKQLLIHKYVILKFLVAMRTSHSDILVKLNEQVLMFAVFLHLMPTFTPRSIAMKLYIWSDISYLQHQMGYPLMASIR